MIGPAVFEVSLLLMDDVFPPLVPEKHAQLAQHLVALASLCVEGRQVVGDVLAFVGTGSIVSREEQVALGLFVAAKFPEQGAAISIEAGADVITFM